MFFFIFDESNSMKMTIVIKEVKCKKDLKQFIYLPAKIYKNNSVWVPPIYSDEWKYFNKKNYKPYKYCDTVLFLVFHGKEVVGRIMGIINKEYNALKNEKTARFEHFVCYDDKEVANLLLDKIKEWAQENGMNELVGPFGFNDKDPQGLLIEGFEHHPVISAIYNEKYLVKLLEEQGFTKKTDLLAYDIPIPEKIPEFYHRIYERANRNNNFEIFEFTSRKKLKPYIVPVFRMVNKTFTDIYGFAPISDKEAIEFANIYLPVIDPEFVKLIFKDGKEVAFILAMPDISQGIKKAKGKLFPFGILKILRAGKKTKKLVLLLGAIDPKYRGIGLDTMLGIKTLLSAQKKGMTNIDSHLELETNLKVRAEMEKMGGKVYKKYRIFKKDI